MESKDSMSLKEFRDYIKSLDIVDVLSKAEAINEEDIAGRKYLCPFHDEKTPSLNFYEDSYYCFGCAEHGDAFTFIEKIYDLSFAQAAALIAEAYDVKLNLVAAAGTNPFKGNGIQTSVLENQWKVYLENMQEAPDNIKQGASIFFPLEVGYDKETSYYVFRYTSKSGKTLGFTKRRAFETEDKSRYPKWIHSKKEDSNIEQCAVMFNLGNAVKYIRSRRHVIFVEGAKDTIPWTSVGKKEVVAISGTHHLKQAYEILPEVDRITLSLDGDSAGRKGMADAVLFLSEIMPLSSIKYVDFGELDPYDYYKKNNSLPEPKQVYSLFDEQSLKKLYNASSPYNKDDIVTHYSKLKSMSWGDAESFLKSSDDKRVKKSKRESEISRLAKSTDEAALEKMKLKYGLE